MTNAKHSAPGFKNYRLNNETHFKITTSQNAAANQASRTLQVLERLLRVKKDVRHEWHLIKKQIRTSEAFQSQSA